VSHSAPRMPYGPYYVCGWKLVSATPLPELLPWAGDDREPDVIVDCDEMLPDVRETAFELLEHDTLRINFEGNVSIDVPKSGACLQVHMARNSDLLMVRNYLYGTGLAALCYRRGFLPLHGSAVRVGDEAVIFSGDSGAGKSTLATAMARRGHRLLSDDVCPFDFCGGGPRPMLRSAFPRVKLLADAIEGFGFGKETVYTESPRGTKGHFGMVSVYAEESISSLPVSAIYMLGESKDEGIHARSLQNQEAFRVVGEQIHRSGVGELLNLRGQTFSQLVKLLSSVPIYALERPRGFDLLDRTVDFIESQHAKEGRIP
jgi:hypothetical protein